MILPHGKPAHESKGKVGEFNYPHREGNLDTGPAKDERLRAINRAPDPVPDLYRDGLINQVDAARLGKKGTNRKRVSSALQKVLDRTEGQPDKERKKAVNEAARKLAGVKKKGPLDHILGYLAKVSVEAFVAALSEEQREEIHRLTRR